MHIQNRQQLFKEVYDRALKINPSFYQALTFKGYSLNSLGNHKEDLQIYDQAIKYNPQYSQAYLNKGSTLQDLQRFDQAIQIYDKVIEHHIHQLITIKVYAYCVLENMRKLFRYWIRLYITNHIISYLTSIKGFVST